MKWILRIGQRCIVAGLLGSIPTASALESEARELARTRDLFIFKDGEEDPLANVNRTLYPDWSNHTAGRWVAIRRADKYSDQQIRALADHDVVMLEKSNGQRTYGNVEKGTLEAAKRIKAVNSNVTVLFYLNAMVHYGGYAANTGFKQEWALRNRRRRNKLFKWRNKYLSYDHTNAEFREWWVQRALDMASHDEIDGVFIDGIVKVHAGDRYKRGHSKAYLRHTANMLRSSLPGGKLLIGNALRAGRERDGNLKHLKYLDGSYLEGWDHAKALPETMKLISIAAEHQRIIMLKAEPNRMNQREYNQIGDLDDRYDFVNEPRFLDFPLGYFLLTAQPHSYFSYRTCVDANPKKKCVFDNTKFEAIMRKLGEPMGNYVDKGRGNFFREFEYLKVQVNIKKRTATLTVKDSGDDGEDV